jgi:hypothetical protein
MNHRSLHLEFRRSKVYGTGLIKQLLLLNDYTRLGELALDVYKRLYPALPVLENVSGTVLCNVTNNRMSRGITEITNFIDLDYNVTFTFTCTNKIPSSVNPDTLIKTYRNLNTIVWEAKGVKFVTIGFLYKDIAPYDIPFVPDFLYLGMGLILQNLLWNSRKYGNDPDNKFKYPYLNTPVADTVFELPMDVCIRSYPYHMWALNGEIWKTYSNILPEKLPPELILWVLQHTSFDRQTSTIDSLAQAIYEDPDLEAATYLSPGFTKEEFEDYKKENHPLSSKSQILHQLMIR